MKVFIADNAAVIRERLVTMLSNLEEVEIIGHAEDALEATSSIRALNPDVVILDIRMRTGNGIDVLQNIKKDNPAPVVIMLTNYLHRQYREKCVKAGADFFFDKSTEFDKITEVLEQFQRQ